MSIRLPLVFSCWCVDKISLLSRDLHILFALVNFINPSLNPIIYAARYEVFRRYLKQKLGKGDVRSNSVSQSTTGTTSKNKSAATRQTTIA